MEFGFDSQAFGFGELTTEDDGDVIAVSRSVLLTLSLRVRLARRLSDGFNIKLPTAFADVAVAAAAAAVAAAAAAAIVFDAFRGETPKISPSDCERLCARRAAKDAAASSSAKSLIIARSCDSDMVTTLSSLA